MDKIFYLAYNKYELNNQVYGYDIITLKNSSRYGLIYVLEWGFIITIYTLYK